MTDLHSRIAEDRKSIATDTFIDAYGRCYIAGKEVPQVVYECHMRQWHNCAEIIARLWQRAAFPLTHSSNALFDPPLTEPQTGLLNEAIADFYPDSVVATTEPAKATDA